ncbi:RnfABCDGE type electron transport complex subunit D [Enterobacter hormaechei]
MVFRIASSPYTHNQRQTSRIMLLVLLAAVPGIAAQPVVFLVGVLSFRSCWHRLVALLAEALVLKLRKQSVAATLKDKLSIADRLIAGGKYSPPRAMVDGRAGVRCLR